MAFKLVVPFEEELKREFNKRSASIEELLIFATQHDCSDLYIKVTEYPYMSRYGNIYKVPCSPTSKELWSNFAEIYVSNERNDSYVHNKQLDLSVEVYVPEDKLDEDMNTKYRYRCALGFSEEKNIATFRMIKSKTITFDTINYPDDCKDMLKKSLKEKRGIIIFSAKTGEGKSTTMAACINTFSQRGEILDNTVWVTLEDPIEYKYNSTDSFKITQKEMGEDFRDFDDGIKLSLREHPNCILVGEIRDKKSISSTIEASRTGHLTMTTFHADDVCGTLRRLLYHLDNSSDLTYDLIANLRCIVSQHLIPSANKYLIDVEYLYFSPKIKQLILHGLRDGKDINNLVEDIMSDESFIASKEVKRWGLGVD